MLYIYMNIAYIQDVCSASMKFDDKYFEKEHYLYYLFFINFLIIFISN